MIHLKVKLQKKKNRMTAKFKSFSPLNHWEHFNYKRRVFLRVLVVKPTTSLAASHG